MFSHLMVYQLVAPLPLFFTAVLVMMVLTGFGIAIWGISQDNRDE